MPGIFVQNAIFGATTTAIGLAEDMKRGIVDRFRSLPMARSSVLAGRATFDLAKNPILVRSSSSSATWSASGSRTGS